MPRLPLTCLVIGLLLPFSIHLHANAPSQTAFREELDLTTEDQPILEAFVSHAVNFAQARTAEEVKAKCLKSPEMFAWIDFRYLQCLNTAYELTHDTAYLDLLKNTFQLYRNAMRTGPDAYLGWYGSPIPPRIPKDNPDIQIDEIQMNFRAISVLAEWVELARSDATYAASNAAVITEYLDLMENHLFPKWDARGFYHDLGDRGGVYGGLDYPLEARDSLSFEKLAIMVDGLIRMYRVTNNPAYLQRALAIGAWFKNSLSLSQPDGHYEWMSWCPSGPWDVSPTKPDCWSISWIGTDPNGEWYVAALSIALNLYQHGLLFSDEDLQRFIRTQKEQCWNGDLEHPVYRTVSGVSAAENKYVKGRFLSYQICPYDTTLEQLAFDGPHEDEVRKNVGNSWQGGVNARDYVRQKYLMSALVAEQPRPAQEYGKRFLSTPENRAFYDNLAFEVVSPGASIPRKPSQADFIHPDTSTIKIVFPGDDWATPPADADVVSQEKVEAAIADLASVVGKDGVSGTMVVQNGYLLWAGDRIDEKRPIWSCTKSFLSTCLGLLWDDGKLTPDDLAVKYLPELAEDYPAVTLRQLATFTSGMHVKGGTLEIGAPDYAPGTAIHYAQQSDILALILTRIAGESLSDLFKRRIADPIGMDPAGWEWKDLGLRDNLVINGGYGSPESGMHMTARNLARFGWLYANSGVWDDQRLISERYISYASAPLVDAQIALHNPKGWYHVLPGCYGLNWWVNGIDAQGNQLWPSAPASTFAAQGNMNNICIVVPEWKLVLVRTGLDKIINVGLYDGALKLLSEGLPASR